MTRIAVKEFIFDDQNLKHISKHNVVEAEIREAGQNLIYHRERGYTILIFVRAAKRRNGITTSFTYLGHVDRVSY